MALIFTESFDWTTNNSIMTKKWQTFTAGIASPGRSGTGNYMSYGYNFFVPARININPTGRVLIAGFGFRRDRQGTNNTVTVLKFWKDSSSIAPLYARPDGRFQWGNQTSTKYYNDLQWYYVEIKIDFASGDASLRVNNELWLDLIGYFSGVIGSGSADGFEFTNLGANNGSINVDDFYVCDGSGSINNDFLGDVIISVLRPDGDSSPLTWTPSTGVTHYNLINETSYDSATYVSDSTPGNRDQYTLPSIVTTAVTIPAVVYNVLANKDVGGDTTLKLYVKSGGSESLSGEYALSANQALNFQHIVETDPATGVAWTKTGVNAAEVGVETA